jgi:hypothetical protein
VKAFQLSGTLQVPVKKDGNNVGNFNYGKDHMLLISMRFFGNSNKTKGNIDEKGTSFCKQHAKALQ